MRWQNKVTGILRGNGIGLIWLKFGQMEDFSTVSYT
jgi:hypothetical protein